MSRQSSCQGSHVHTCERLRWPKLWVQGVLWICQSSVSAVLLQRLGLRHDAFRLSSWRPPRRSLCDGLEGLVRTRDSRLFLKWSRMSLPAQAPDPGLQSRPARAPSSRGVDSRLDVPAQAHKRIGTHNNGCLNNLVQERPLSVSTVLCIVLLCGYPCLLTNWDVHYSINELREPVTHDDRDIDVFVNVLHLRRAQGSEYSLNREDARGNWALHHHGMHTTQWMNCA